jgi:multidrug transporter EmrE-like cation transporter
MADVPSIPRFAVLTGAMLILAGLDIFGALMAKQWADQGSRPCFLIGLAIFAVLFSVYATSLKTAELSVVTMGWVVLLQVGLLLADRFRFQVEFSWDKWLAIAIILILQSYLILDPFGGTRS